MGLFNFLKKKSTETAPAALQNNAVHIDKNLLVLEALDRTLVIMGYTVIRHPQYLALIVNDELELSVAVIENPDNHPYIMQLMIAASHQKYFADGIIENIVGIGTSIEDRVSSALDNYIDSTFFTVIDSLSDTHNPDLDFISTANDREVLWHPKLGNLLTQGQWYEQPQNETIFDLLKDTIPDLLVSNKINWLKIYISKQANGEIIGECLFNNSPWDTGLNEISNYTKTWKVPGEFCGLKQFIMFRRCDAYDN